MGARVIIGGDVYLAGRQMGLFEDGEASDIFGPILSEFQNADCVVVNLESPLFDGNSPIIKNGPVLKASTKSINALLNAQVKIVNLSNNHILDHGEAGVRSTIETCTQKGILTFGAGPNLQAARKILVMTIQNINIGFIGIAEHEFSTATEQSWGANPLDLIDYVRNIKANRSHYDYLIVFLHGGNEHYQFPSPRLMKTCHFLVEEGANVVICQHSHCAGCFEEYLGSHIVYGQGNLLFDMPNQRDNFYEGFLVKLEIEKTGSSRLSLIPFEQCRRGFGVRSLSEKVEKEFMLMINLRSEAILKKSFVREKWIEFCEQRKYHYLSTVLGHNRLLKRLNRSGYLTKMLYSKANLVAVQNVVSCESHRDAIETILEMERLFS